MRPGVIFDLDGVLVASGPAHAASWKLTARKHGRSVSDADFQRTFGRPSRDIIRILWGAGLTEDEVRRIDDEKEAMYRDLVRGMVPLMIGARETLADLFAANIALAVGTSGPPENVELVLGETNLAHYFRAVVTGFDVQLGKPAPDCFLLAAERLALAPRDCLVVEDAPVGIQAARNAGILAVGLTGTHSADALREAGAAAVMSELRQITPAFVAELWNGAARD
jgi:beta-phosphoglucomutase